MYNFRSAGGWSSLPLSVMVGQVSSIFAVLGSDGVVHLSEEVEAAAIFVPQGEQTLKVFDGCWSSLTMIFSPQGMIWSYLLNAPLLFLGAVTYCFNMPSLERAIHSPAPLATVFQDAFQHAQITMGFSIIMIVLLAMTTINALASTSRLLYAFA